MRLLFHTIRHSAVYDILSFRALGYSAITCSRIFRHSTVSPFHCSIITSNRDLGIVLRILVASQTKRLFCALSSIKFFFFLFQLPYVSARRQRGLFWNVCHLLKCHDRNWENYIFGSNSKYSLMIISSLVRTCQTSFPLKRKISTVHVLQKGTSD